MTPRAAAADRHEAIRDAARVWRRAGLIDESVRQALDNAAPDDRRRLGPVLRTLAFGFTVVAAVAGLSLFLLLAGSHSDIVNASLTLGFGLGLLATTEILKERWRLATAGVESAAGLTGAALLWAGSAWLLTGPTHLTNHRLFLPLVFALGAAVFAAVAQHWGSATSALTSVACIELALAQTGEPRLAWTLAAVVGIPAGLWLAGSAVAAPSHRRCGTAVAMTSIVGLYVAWHLGSWDARLLEHGFYQSGSPRPDLPPLPRAVSIWATALLPVVVTTCGLATRRRVLWLVGSLLGVASLATLRAYVHLAPLWVVLSASGLLLIAGALALRRWLHSGPDHERGGFTAQPLSDEGHRLGLADLAVSAAAMSAAATHQTSEPAAGFRAGEGRSGGAGASGKY